MYCITIGFIPSPAFGIEVNGDEDNSQIMIFLLFLVISFGWRRWVSDEA